MVAATWGWKKGERYNQHLMDGFYTCDTKMVEGLSNSGDYGVPSCYCNPNYEWSNYTMRKP